MIELVDVNALIEHLNTTMYRDAIEEIKKFPVIMKVNTDLLKCIEKGTMNNMEIVIDRSAKEQMNNEKTSTEM